MLTEERVAVFPPPPPPPLDAVTVTLVSPKIEDQYTSIVIVIHLGVVLQKMVYCQWIAIFT